MKKSVIVAIIAMSVGFSGSVHAGGRFEGFTRMNGPALQEVEISCEEITDHLSAKIRSLKGENKRLACVEKCYQDIQGSSWSSSLMLNQCELACATHEVDISAPKVAPVEEGRIATIGNRFHDEILTIPCEENVERLKKAASILQDNQTQLSCELQCYADNHETSAHDDWSAILLNNCISSCHTPAIGLPDPSEPDWNDL